jgi:hypothetical protein
VNDKAKIVLWLGLAMIGFQVWRSWSVLKNVVITSPEAASTSGGISSPIVGLGIGGTLTKTGPESAIPTGGCQKGWTKINGKCYQVEGLAMPVPTQGNGPSVSSGKPSTGVTSAHSVVVTVLAEAAGVFTLAIIADMNEDMGGLMVALMVAWFVIFLMTNNTLIAGLTSKV